MPLINRYILAAISYSHGKYIQLSFEAIGKNHQWSIIYKYPRMQNTSNITVIFIHHLVEF